MQYQTAVLQWRLRLAESEENISRRTCSYKMQYLCLYRVTRAAACLNTWIPEIRLENHTRGEVHCTMFSSEEHAF